MDCFADFNCIFLEVCGTDLYSFLQNVCKDVTKIHDLRDIYRQNCDLNVIYFFLDFQTFILEVCESRPEVQVH